MYAFFLLYLLLYNITLQNDEKPGGNVMWSVANIKLQVWAIETKVKDKTIFKADLSSYKPPPYLFNIKSISVHPLLWMNVMLDFICMVFAELSSTGYKRKIQNDDFYATAGNWTSDPSLTSVSLKPLGYRRCWRHVNKTLTNSYLCYDTTTILCRINI